MPCSIRKQLPHADPVPFMDLASLHAPIQKKIEQEISRLVSRSSFVLGPEVERFEERFATYCETRYAIGCNSGTAAIHMALTALDIGPGDEVITVSHTFIGTVWGILYCGATPVFADIDATTMNLDVTRVEALVTPRTRAIIPVHLYGQPVDMDPLLDIARRHDLYVVEDAAQAHGARYRGRRVGTLGHMACFSFYPGKNLGAWGEAGAVVTADPVIAQKLRRLRDHGQPMRYNHSHVGFNYRMDAIQATVLNTKLDYLDGWNKARKVLATGYSERLEASSLRLPGQLNDVEHVHHLYVVRHPSRDAIVSQLDAAGISAGLHYPKPVHRQEALQSTEYLAEDLSVSDEVSSQCLSLPLYPGMPSAHQDRVIDKLLEILRSDA